MTNGIVIFLVDVFKRAEVFQRAADGFGEVLLAHEHPKALHATLRASLHFDGEEVHILYSEVVNLCDALTRLLPIIHAGTLYGGSVTHHL